MLLNEIFWFSQTSLDHVMKYYIMLIMYQLCTLVQNPYKKSLQMEINQAKQCTLVDSLNRIQTRLTSKQHVSECVIIRKTELLFLSAFYS